MKSRSTEINYSPIICLTVKFRTSFVITRRKVCELHPVSRHVRFQPCQVRATRPTDCVPRVCFKVSGNFGTTWWAASACVRSVGILQQTHYTRRWGASVIDFPCAPSVSLCWLCASTAGEASSSVHYHLPWSLTLKGPCDAHRSRKALSLSLLPHKQIF